MSQDSYLVVGGGNTGLATSVHLSSQGNPVYLFSRRYSSISQTKIVRSTGICSPGNYPIAACANQIEEIAAANEGKLPGNIVICCRGQDIESYARILGAYINSQSNILIICASRFSGRVFGKVLQREFDRLQTQLPAVGDVNNSPFACRGNADDEVRISKFKNQFKVAAQNSEMTERIVAAYQDSFKSLRTASSSLEVNLDKCNDIFHVPLIIASLARWELGESYNIYRGFGPRTANLIGDLDSERLAIAKALGFPDLSNMYDYFKTAFGTPGPSLYEHIHQIKALDNATIRNPHHRYLSEELPFGAFPLQALARLTGVDTPCLDSCITLGSKFIDEPLTWTAQFLELDIQWLNSQLTHN
ncbi:NAD/NADP octopine/nopaline dehydrogenase family protein [Moorena producens]|nr:NAD/NADP octopine/nopaline dehydrogenase family protein [Moorena producens]